MKANYENKMQETKSEVALGNLYDMNKQMMLNEPPMSKDKQLDTINNLREWLINNFNQKYVMLLCHERRDYTLFNLDKTSTWRKPDNEKMHLASADVIECLTNRGELLSATLQPDGAWEMWIRLENECFAYYLFPYGQAVLEY